MRYFTHALIGGLTVAAVSAGQPPLLRAGIIAAGVVGALVPDIDEPHSYVGRRVPITSLIVHLVSGGHRGLTHTLLANVLWALLTAWACRSMGLPGAVAAGAAVGYLTHLLADLPQGVPLFWPLHSKRLTVGLPLETGSVGESALAGVLFLAALQMLLG